MLIENLPQIMRCPLCDDTELSIRNDQLICSANHSVPITGNSVRLEAIQAEQSDEWKAQQAAGATDYQAGHGVSQGSDPVARLFGGFMAVTLRREHLVLDIGCGMSGMLPDYVNELSLENYFGLEPLPVADAAFPVLSGGVAEKLPVQDSVLDAIMFVTSQDHIEGIDEAMAEARRVLKPGGRAYMLIGIYDPDIIAKVKTFDVIWRGSPLKRAARLAAAQVEYAHTLLKMRQRRSKLATGARIDPYHCRYYTRDRVTADLKRWGFTETRRIEVPNGSTLFVEAV